MDLLNKGKEVLGLYKKGTGALTDTRARVDKEKDYLFKEIVATSTPVVWEERTPRQFPIRSQNGSGSCVAFSMAKMLGILQYANKGGRFVDFSPAFVYQRRANKNIGDGQGMNGWDVWNIVRKDGITLDPLMPSDNLTEVQINAVQEEAVYRDVAQLFRVENYVSYIAGKDFDAIAGTIQKTGKGVMVWFRFDYNEWTTMPIIRTATPTLHHAVCAVDAVVYKGEECLVIDDSWGTAYGKEGQRFITRDFFEKRNTHASYPISFKTGGEVYRPKYTFKGPMRQGQTNSDVKVLQDILKFEGHMATNIASSGYYGVITARAVLAFQRKYQVASELELASLGGSVAGEKTIAKLNELYS
jgi:hypothetical protein